MDMEIEKKKKIRRKFIAVVFRCWTSSLRSHKKVCLVLTRDYIRFDVVNILLQEAARGLRAKLKNIYRIKELIPSDRDLEG